MGAMWILTSMGGTSMILSTFWSDKGTYHSVALLVIFLAPEKDMQRLQTASDFRMNTWDLNVTSILPKCPKPLANQPIFSHTLSAKRAAGCLVLLLLSWRLQHLLLNLVRFLSPKCKWGYFGSVACMRQSSVLRGGGWMRNYFKT